jgi:7,8-dihydropterin-6-yl-methyl-4-(beta-D-ribofuranosyl)aminobenzene 5'-phosphate synthase
MSIQVNEVDRVEVMTLQDNYIDLASMDSTEMVQRAIPLKGMAFSNSILAEHGFSSVITVFRGDESRSLLFDFGFSSHGAAHNADALNVDLNAVEAAALSHGHSDHTGGFKMLADRMGKKGIELVAHPAAFRTTRYLKVTEEFKIQMPYLTKEEVEKAGMTSVATDKPYLLMDGTVLFLGEIKRSSEFEKGMPNAFYEADGEEVKDDLEDDTAVVANVRGKGLVIVSGCAHAGIINTINHAMAETGVDQIYAVMGGFHLTGPLLAPVIEPTVNALKDLNPAYIVPTHCTGRMAIQQIEKEMPEKFLLNMVGTRMIFSA